MVQTAIGIDLGGTRIKGVLIETSTGRILNQLITPTDDGAGMPWQQAVLDTVQALKQQAHRPNRRYWVIRAGSSHAR